MKLDAIPWSLMHNVEQLQAALDVPRRFGLFIAIHGKDTLEILKATMKSIFFSEINSFIWRYNSSMITTLYLISLVSSVFRE